jgi:hypothetical protein
MCCWHALSLASLLDKCIRPRAVCSIFFTRGGSKACMLKKVPNIQIIINDILKIMNIFSGGGGGLPPCPPLCTALIQTLSNTICQSYIYTIEPSSGDFSLFWGAHNWFPWHSITHSLNLFVILCEEPITHRLAIL